jgi:CDP-6-deoxy-D-xylo-4-hexulose-3-dehydrase
MTPYPLATSSWGEEELAALHRVIAGGRFTMGAEVRRLEEAFAQRLGVVRCVMVNSGSSANLLMAAALRYRTTDRLEPGDEVIVPAVGWATTYYPFAQQGFRLRLVDVDPGTLNLDPVALAAAITPATRAVCLVHALGNPCDLGPINAVLEEARGRGQDICLLEDTCEALGAVYGGRSCGTDGLMGTYSFFFSHHISTMEGGMVVTDDAELAEILVCLRAHGWTRDLPDRGLLAGAKSPDPFEESFRFLLPGFNVRPLELSAAVGLEQLRKLDAFTATRRRNARTARELLAPHAGWITMQRELGESSWFGFSLLVREGTGTSRPQVVRALSDAGIECRPIITGNFARQPVLRHIDHSIAGDLAGADAVHDRGLFVGNAERDLECELTHLAATLSSLRPPVEVAA